MSEDPPGGDFLCLRGALKRAQGQASQAQDKEANKIDRENQLVVHDPGLEKVEGPLIGSAEKIRSVPKNTFSHKPKGRYSITDVRDASYNIGTQLVLDFRGNYHGKQANFDSIIVEIVNLPITQKGHQYVEVKFPYNQRVFIKNFNKYVYLSTQTKSFHVQIH